MGVSVVSNITVVVSLLQTDQFFIRLHRVRGLHGHTPWNTLHKDILYKETYTSETFDILL